jgi:hypothetical protein
VGVGIHGDALKMQRDWGLEPHGVVDLSEAAQDRGVFNGEPGAKWSLAGPPPAFRQTSVEGLDLVLG